MFTLLVFTLVGLAIATPISSSSPLFRRANCSAVDLVGLNEAVPETTEGALMLQWQPYLYVEDGCVPFPAVDSTGCTSAGMSPTGDPSGDCDSSTGQVYARAEEYNSAYAIMYSWYFSKDEPSWLESVVGVGHRYDWEDCIVWLSEASANATLLGVSVSFHGSKLSTGARKETIPGFRLKALLMRLQTTRPLLVRTLVVTIL
jgi:hypothetical protein